MSRIRCNQKKIHWILTQIWRKLSKFTNLQKTNTNKDIISYQDIIPLHHIPFKRWLPLSFRSVPFPLISAPDLCASRLGFCPQIGFVHPLNPLKSPSFQENPQNPRLYEDSPPKQGFQSVGVSLSKDHFCDANRRFKIMTLVIVTVWTGIDKNMTRNFRELFDLWEPKIQNCLGFIIKEFDSWDRKDHFTTM